MLKGKAPEVPAASGPWWTAWLGGEQPPASSGGSSSGVGAPSSDSIGAWLEAIQPGYNERFAAAFDEIGIEDTEDFANLDDEIFAELEVALQRSGARQMHMRNIQQALLDTIQAAGVMPPTLDWLAEPTWKCEHCSFMGSHHEVVLHEATCRAEPPPKHAA